MKRRAAMDVVGESEDPVKFGLKKILKICLILASFRIHDIRLHFRKNDSRSNEFALNSTYTSSICPVTECIQTNQVPKITRSNFSKKKPFWKL